MAATDPQDGDLIVHPANRQSVFVLTPVGAQWETTCPTYEDALQVAERLAHIYQTTIWFTKDGVTFDLVRSCRAES